MEKIFVDMINANRGIIYRVCNLYCLEKEYKQDLFQESYYNSGSLSFIQKRIVAYNMDVPGDFEYSDIEFSKRDKKAGAPVDFKIRVSDTRHLTIRGRT